MSMPLSNDDLNSDFMVIPTNATVRAVRDAIPQEERRKRYIVTPLPNENFAVFRLADLIAYLKSKAQGDRVEPAMLSATLDELDEFRAAFTRPGVARAAELADILKNWNRISDPALAVIEQGNVVGVLASQRRGSGDVDWLDNEPQSANGGGHISHAKPPQGEQPTPDTLSPAETTPAAPPPRVINVSFEPPEQKDQPLVVGETYTLAFSVELNRLPDAIAGAPLDERRIFPPNVDQVELYVQLLSDDFDIATEPQKLIVPREGKSKNKARFDISPKQNGVGELTAVLTRDGNAVQAITLKLNVGAAGQAAIVESKTLGRPVEAVGAVQPRGLTMWIDYIGAGFKVSVLDPNGTTSFMVPLQLQELEQAISDARAALLAIVNLNVNGNLVYQSDIDIAPAVNQKTLPQLAQAGYLLFQNIFMHPGSGQPARDFVKRLRDLVQGDTLKIQIISKEMLLPWGILYLADRFDPNNIQPELFLGLKHIIEHAPMQPDMDFVNSIATQPQLTVSLNVNQDIDAQMNYPLVGNQIKYWNAVQQKTGVKLITRNNGNDLLNALADEKTPDQIAYFYCHALSASLAQGGAQASVLQLAKGDSVTLKDFMLRAPNDIRLDSAPLVFINACESAELSPLFYNGFMPYFVDKGARGLIGTECSVPGLFAMDWAQKFFDQFLAGKPLGQIFLDLRRDYFFNHRNILGLLYAVYCDADTQVTPRLNL